MNPDVAFFTRARLHHALLFFTAVCFVDISSGTEQLWTTRMLPPGRCAIHDLRMQECTFEIHLFLFSHD